jgi:hypothetical protein
MQKEEPDISVDVVTIEAHAQSRVSRSCATELLVHSSTGVCALLTIDLANSLNYSCNARRFIAALPF